MWWNKRKHLNHKNVSWINPKIYALNLSPKKPAAPVLLWWFLAVSQGAAHHPPTALRGSFRRPFRLPSLRHPLDSEVLCLHAAKRSPSEHRLGYALLKSIKAFSVFLFFPQREIARFVLYTDKRIWNNKDEGGCWI